MLAWTSWQSASLAGEGHFDSLIAAGGCRVERKDVRRSPANLLLELPREFRKFGSNRIECGFDLSNENFPQPFASWEGLRSNQEVRAVFAVSGLFEN